MLKSLFHSPLFSALRRTGHLWLYYACIPVVILACVALRSFVFPALPAAIVVLLIDVVLLFATHYVYRIWKIRTVLFPKKELPYVRAMFMLIPLQLVFICVSAVMVFQ